MQKLQSNRIYTAFSAFDIFWHIIVRGFIIFGMFYCLQHYEENPPVVVGAVIILFLFFLIIGSESIVIYEDAIIKKSDSLASIFFFKSKPVVNLTDVKRVWLEEKNTGINLFELGVAVLIHYLFIKRNRTANTEIPIFFELKNGEEVKVFTSLSEKEAENIVEIVKKIIKQKH